MLLSRSALEECTDDDLVPGELSQYDAVVVGLAPALLDYAHLNTAFRILVGENRPRDAPDPAPKSTPNLDIEAQPHSRPPLIALHKARYLEASDNALSLGPGPFVHALEEAARTSATVVGKPTRAFFEAVLCDLDRDLEEVSNPSDLPHDRSGQRPHRWEGIAVIGDDVRADLGEGAIELGLWRVLGASCPLFFYPRVAPRIMLIIDG
jgi:ribonucleotide monophosphatase NagD (HAD superfamily)